MWLLTSEVAAQMAHAIKAGLYPTAEQCAQFIAQRTEAFTDEKQFRALKVAGDSAEIRVEGVLTAKPDFFAYLFGGGNTTYADIQAALARAQTDPAIRKVVFNIASPGGETSGLFETLEAISAFTKPVRVVASMAASAAYAIAAVAGPIEATSPAAPFGSIGVAARLFAPENVYEIASTEAPKKRPDPSTDEGKAIIREYLDSIHDLFVNAIAKGRGVDVDTVNQTFGRGATLVATEAKRLGMIDKISTPVLRPAGGGERRKSRVTGEHQEGEITTMDLSTLKKEHPDVYAAVVAEAKAEAPKVAAIRAVEKPAVDLEAFKAQQPELYAAAFRAGEVHERDRVTAHLTLGEQCGDMKLAVNAIKGGDLMTLTLQAQYMAAGINRGDRATRQTDSKAAAAALDGADPEAAKLESLGDAVASRVEAALGTGKKRA